MLNTNCCSDFEDIHGYPHDFYCFPMFSLFFVGHFFTGPCPTAARGSCGSPVLGAVRGLRIWGGCQALERGMETGGWLRNPPADRW